MKSTPWAFWTCLKKSAGLLLLGSVLLSGYEPVKEEQYAQSLIQMGEYYGAYLQYVRLLSFTAEPERKKKYILKVGSCLEQARQYKKALAFYTEQQARLLATDAFGYTLKLNEARTRFFMEQYDKSLAICTNQLSFSGSAGWGQALTDRFF